MNESVCCLGFYYFDIFWEFCYPIKFGLENAWVALVNIGVIPEYLYLEGVEKEMVRNFGILKVTMGENGVEESEIAGNVNKVKQNWQVFEDFGLAYRLQNNEFSEHYDKNRCERRLMHRDICVTKEEQKVEDSYAAAYYEQLRRDQLKEDERLAMELQRRLDEEGQMDQLARDQGDRVLAKRLQNLEMNEKPPDSRGVVARRMASLASASSRLDANLLESSGHISQAYAITKSPSGNRLILPAGMTPELIKAIEEANDNDQIVLPPGFTFEQYHALQKAAIEEDRRVAEEVQDYELARFVQNQEKPKEINCVKPSELLALSKGVEYSKISKPSKPNIMNGSSKERQSAKRHQQWAQFD